MQQHGLTLLIQQKWFICLAEDGSLPQEVLDQAHRVVYVPTHGCMNLTATVNVVLYDRLAKSLGEIDDQTQVIANRDNKNRLKVKS